MPSSRHRPRAGREHSVASRIHPPPCQSAATVNATGPCGQPACGSGHVHRGGLPHVGPSSVINGACGQPTGTNSHTRITCSFLHGHIGDGGTTGAFPVNLTVITTRTGAEDPRGAGTVNATDTVLPDGPSDMSVAARMPMDGEFSSRPVIRNRMGFQSRARNRESTGKEVEISGDKYIIA